MTPQIFKQPRYLLLASLAFMSIPPVVLALFASYPKTTRELLLALTIASVMLVGAGIWVGLSVLFRTVTVAEEGVSITGMTGKEVFRSTWSEVNHYAPASSRKIGPYLSWRIRSADGEATLPCGPVQLQRVMLKRLPSAAWANCWQPDRREPQHYRGRVNSGNDVSLAGFGAFWLGFMALAFGMMISSTVSPDRRVSTPAWLLFLVIVPPFVAVGILLLVTGIRGLRSSMTIDSESLTWRWGPQHGQIRWKDVVYAEMGRHCYGNWIVASEREAFCLQLNFPITKALEAAINAYAPQSAKLFYFGSSHIRNTSAQ